VRKKKERIVGKLDIKKKIRKKPTEIEVWDSGAYRSNRGVPKKKKDLEQRKRAYERSARAVGKDLVPNR